MIDVGRCTSNINDNGEPPHRGIISSPKMEPVWVFIRIIIYTAMGRAGAILWADDLFLAQSSLHCDLGNRTNESLEQ